jgi:hypothetical protein
MVVARFGLLDSLAPPTGNSDLPVEFTCINTNGSFDSTVKYTFTNQQQCNFDSPVDVLTCANQRHVYFDSPVVVARFVGGLLDWTTAWSDGDGAFLA